MLGQYVNKEGTRGGRDRITHSVCRLRHELFTESCRIRNLRYDRPLMPIQFRHRGSDLGAQRAIAAAASDTNGRPKIRATYSPFRLHASAKYADLAQQWRDLAVEAQC